jgi:CreA protein
MAFAEEIGSVNTNFKVFGSDKVVVEAFDDPQVKGVTCYVSRAKTGGLKGAAGLAEDTSDAAIACRQVGPIVFGGSIPQKDEIFSERRSLVFKTLHVVRFVDKARNALVYLTYSDRLVSGSAKNSVTAVAVPGNQPVPVK